MEGRAGTNKTPKSKFCKKPLPKLKFKIGIILLPDQLALSRTRKVSFFEHFTQKSSKALYYFV